MVRNLGRNAVIGDRSEFSFVAWVGTLRYKTVVHTYVEILVGWL
jgi:hypothetical protein